MGSIQDTALSGGAAGEMWRLHELAPTDRAEGWRDVVARTHLPWQVDEPAVDLGRPFEAMVRRRRFADVDLLDCRCDPCSGSRGRVELRDTEVERIGVLAVLAGREVLEQDGRRVELRAGDVALWDSSRPARFAVVEPLRKRTILLPRARVVGSGPDRGGWTATALPRGTLTADLLRAQLGVLARRSPAEGRHAEEVAAGVVADVVSGCVSAFAAAATADDDVAATTVPGPATAARRLALRQAVDAHIERRLSLVERGRPLRPDELTPGALAAGHAISTRALHQLFEDAGDGVAAHVRRLRLEGARRQLGRDGHRTIAGIAAVWGFRDAPHFSRAYRQQFGERPRDTVERAHTERDSSC